ncbi:hypothetical protein [Pedobacter frigiditerrae]|uniref:hypothetical protein n=1 Tax=Pedobacter frigiditerrae TaxID=2530452 RepID=UPI00292E7B3B|nr:hypothetical protein [Pedobacter frigiditerrae]
MKTLLNIPTVSIPDAKARVERFRRQLSGSMPESNIPRAVLIPIADILQIIDKYQYVDEDGVTRNELRGVRAYFAVKQGDQDLPDDVTALIVPVDLKGNDIVKDPELGEGEDDKTEIYDFTKPCPDQCDPESPLFVV